MNKNFILFIMIILASCYAPKVTINQKKLEELSKKSNDTIKNTSADTTGDTFNQFPLDEFVYLFFDRSNFVKRVESVKPIAIILQPLINPDDFNVLADWQIEGNKRKIKVKNNRTGKEYIVTEGDTHGYIVLVSRNLFYYELKIENSIIKVKR